LAAEIHKEFESGIELIRGGSGDFIVTVDGNVLFSKAETGRFPEHEEILSQMRNQ
jgi:selT/selW/selH-like putative selenoprotein